MYVRLHNNICAPVMLLYLHVALRGRKAKKKRGDKIGNQVKGQMVIRCGPLKARLSRPTAAGDFEFTTRILYQNENKEMGR